MKQLFIIISGLLLSMYFTDIESSSMLKSVIAPIADFLFLVALAVWLVLKAGFGAQTDDRSGGSGGI